MATYNGASYLRPQINSILAQMKDHDELIVLDDGSKDDTILILENFSDERIRIFRNKANLGHVQSFAKVLSLTQNPFLLMADQDDIWVEGRLELMRKVLTQPDVWLVSGNSKFISQSGDEIKPLHPDLNPSESNKNWINILRIFTGKAYYDGCAMAFKKELIPLILPVPNYVESHDLWIAMAANLVRKNLHLKDVILYRRIHGENASIVSRPFFQKIWSRIIFLRSLIHLSARTFRVKPHLSI